MAEINIASTENRCAFCGAPNAKSFLDGRNVHYCNYRCAVAGNFELWCCLFVLFMGFGITALLNLQVFFIFIAYEFGFLPSPLPEILSFSTLVLFYGTLGGLGYSLQAAFRLRQEQLNVC